MILLNRGETAETIKQSIGLIKVGRPEIYYFSNLAFFPGTEEWAVLCEQQGFTPDIFFRNDFKELNVTTNRHQEFQDVFLQVVCDIGAFYGFRYSVEEREAVVERLPNLHSVHVELANAYFRAGRLDEAESALNRAEELGFPIDDIIYNQRACIALARGEVANALMLLERACQDHSTHIGMGNLENLRVWANIPLNDRGKPPLLNDSVLALDFYRGSNLPKQFQNLPLGLAEGGGF
jgi:pentatricopeptide repeat protein